MNSQGTVAKTEVRARANGQRSKTGGAGLHWVAAQAIGGGELGLRAWRQWELGNAGNGGGRAGL